MGTHAPAGPVSPRASRTASAWQRASARGEALLVSYLIAGDPDPAASLELLSGVVLAGTDLLELGLPSAAPLMDGAVIRRGHARSLAAGTPGPAFYRAVRARVAAPIWAMGYGRQLLRDLTPPASRPPASSLAWPGGPLLDGLLGEELIDGLILPDLPYLEHRPLYHALEGRGIDMVRLVHLGMSGEALRATLEGATAVYAQAYAGATGNPLAGHDQVSQLLGRVRQYSGALTVLGFGLRTPEKVAAAMNAGFDGAVVGTALVERCGLGEEDALYALVARMKAATRREERA